MAAITRRAPRSRFIIREVVVQERIEREPVKSPRDVWRYAVGRGFDRLNVEEFRVLLLDSQGHLVEDVLVSRGILNSTLVHPREVFRKAINCEEGCHSLTLLHNHPSGDPTPSADDLAITSQLVAAGQLLGIPVNDHIIIGSVRFVSFAKAGLL